MDRAALGHALARVNDGFDIARMVGEFRALRATVGRIWWQSVPSPHREQIEDMGRFNEALDQLVAASLAAFIERIDRSRRLFLGILGHDLRQPLQSLRMLTDLLTRPEQLPSGTAPVLSSMTRCCDGMAKMLGDLLDFTSSQLGCEMSVSPAASNLELICREVMEEVQAAVPGATFNLEIAGDLAGEWDASRLRQMISNLLANAVQHGSGSDPIDLTLRGADEEVILAVHNTGSPIPPDSIDTLFDPMVRLPDDNKTRVPGSIGLGLYICRQIALAHHGEIEVESSAARGTTFTVRLPRRASLP
jgi:signal transduction histidine kinase